MTTNADSKFFQRGKVQELRAELNSEKRDAKHVKKRIVLKKIVANMTMGNDMSPLFSDVIACMSIQVLEIKKMVYLYLVNYAKNKPDLAQLTISGFTKDLADTNPLIRALALRTMGYLAVDKVMDSLSDHLKRCLDDKDPYVCKTAAIAVAKLFIFDRRAVESGGFISRLQNLLNHENSTVISNAVAALTEISDKSETFTFKINFSVANKMLTALDECSEWGQVYLLESLLSFVPTDHSDAEVIAERAIPRLQHANSAVVLASIRVILYMTNYILKDDIVDNLYRKLGPPLITLLHNGPEVQYVALRNIMLILQRHPDFLRNEIKIFFCKYNDPIYVKLAKLEIMFRLVSDGNVDQVLSELREYASEVDVDFVRKAVRCIGRCAIKIPSSADKCVEALVELIHTQVTYVVQEVIIVVKDIFRRYPNRYENIIATLCNNLDTLDESEAKAAMIWIIGQYSDRIENAAELLEQFQESAKEEAPDVQLSLLTAVVKLFIKRPSAGQDLVLRVLNWATEDVDNPDLRDRGFIYWRLLSTDPVAAKAVVLSDSPPISTETENLAPTILEDLLLHVSTLSSIYHRPLGTFIGGVKPKRIEQSSALVVRDFSSVNPHLDVVLQTQANTYNDDDVPLYQQQRNLNMQESNEDAESLYPTQEMERSTSYAFEASHDIKPLSLGPLTVPDMPAEPAAVQAKIPSNTNGNLLDLDFLENISSNATPKTTSGLIDLDLGLAGLAPMATPKPSIPQVAPVQTVASIPVASPATGNPFFNNTISTSVPPVGPLAVQPYGFAFGNVPPLGGQPLTANGLSSLNNFGVGQQFAQAPNLQPPNSVTSTAPFATNGQNNAGEIAVNTTTLDPFAMTAAGFTANATQNLANTMNALSISAPSGPQSFVPDRTTWLAAQSGKGLEIQGTFSRRQGKIAMELHFSNQSGQMLGQFAILFNKNSFGLAPAAPLQLNPLLPNQIADCVLPIKTDGLVSPVIPANNLQVAVKCSAGIVYFQTLIPLHVLFVEDGQMEQEAWLRMWREEIPASNESTTSFSLTRLYGDVEEIRQKLHLNNIFTIAQRTIDGMSTFFTAVKLVNGARLLSELKIGSDRTSAFLATKSISLDFVGAFETAFSQVLNSRPS